MNRVMLGTDADCSIDCLQEFTSATMSEIKNVIERSTNKSCEIDPVPTCFLKSCLHELQSLENLFCIKSKSFRWITFYLSNRYQTVCINGELSKPVLMKFSVPQGSVLGPKYYTMYTKPVGSICRNHGLVHHFYADDLQLYLSFRPTDKVAHTEALFRVDSSLNEIVARIHDNMLKLYTDKTEVIVFASQRISNVIVTVGETNIEASSCVKSNGASLDSKLNMEKHVNMVTHQ